MGKCCLYAIYIKLVGLITSVFAVLLLGICFWTLTETFISPEEEYLEPGPGKTPQNESDENRTEFVLFENSTGITNEGDNEVGMVIGGPNLEDMSNGNTTQILNIWETMSPKFKNIIQLCLAVTITIGLAQLIVSVMVLCSTRKRLRGKAKFWQLVHFVIILLLLMCILVPLSYNRDKDKFRGAFTFGKYIKNQIMTLIRAQHNIDASVPQSLVQFFLTDVNAFYVANSLNILVLFNSLMISCCCIQCRAKNYYQSV